MAESKPSGPSGMGANENEKSEDEFTWGEPEHEGASNTKRQRYYKSFWYDGEQFFLYDYVYMNSGEEDAPYIGKIMRLWEIPEKKLKKVRVRWLYRPSDIPEEITDVDRSPSNKEVFISCGERDGVENVNDLEVVCGKCKILCTAIDKRNKLPSESELAEAHHFFSRSFNVDEQELYPNLEKVIEELGARKVFTYGWVSAPNDRALFGKVKNEEGIKSELENIVSSLGNENVSAKGKRLQRKALECEGPQVFEEDNQPPASASKAHEDAPEKNDIVEHDLASSTGTVLPEKDISKLSVPKDAKGSEFSEGKGTITPELKNDSKQVKRHLEELTDVQRKKLKVQSEKPKNHASSKKGNVGSVISKSPKNLEKSISSGNLEAKDDMSKNLQFTLLKRELHVPVKGGHAIPSKKFKVEDQKSGDKGKVGRSIDDPESKKKSLFNISSKNDKSESGSEAVTVAASSPRPNIVSPASDSKVEDSRMVEKRKNISSVGAKKVDIAICGAEVGKFTAGSVSAKDSTEEQKVGDSKQKSLGILATKKTTTIGSGSEVGKVKAISPKHHMADATPDSKDNAKRSLTQILSKKGVENSIEGVESGVHRKIKADNQKRTDESNLLRGSSLQLSSKSLVSGDKGNKANGISPKDMDKVPPSRSLETGIFKKSKGVDQMSGAVTQSPRGSDNNFRSLLDRDSAKTMMLDTKSKPSESRALVATERRRIFREPTPEEKLERGFRDGKVIHLKNFDISLTREDLEGALRSLIPRCELVMLSQKNLPHIFPSSRGDTVLDSGQALLVFRDKSQGDAALNLLQDSCVVLAEDGRPLVATEVEQRLQGKNKFLGHFNLDRFRILRNSESQGVRNAVATSHCSQPNTIEYEMAVQWRVIDEQEQMQWEQLRKKQEEAIKLLLRKHT